MQVLRSNTINYYTNQISIYIHFPWCIKKCPYCDFNSYVYNNKISEQDYIHKLLIDFAATYNFLLDINANKKTITSIFFGGGTPSLLSGKSIYKILNHINKHISFAKDIEITLEVNPATVEQDNMHNYYLSGINRISVGAQSFQSDKLQLLGRIHNIADITRTIRKIVKNNFINFNIDLMYGLPNQSVQDALYDLQQAISLEPSHISWYQLTIEPDTVFYRCPPKLPPDNIIGDIMQNGFNILKQHNYINYEVSAFSKYNYQCRHNVNYWQYGDYLGLGPGAHSKITSFIDKKIFRLAKPKTPKNYFSNDFNFNNMIYNKQILPEKQIIFEFMLNNLRLTEGFLKKDFKLKTFIELNVIADILNIATNKNLLKITKERIKTTVFGRRFLNDLQEMFV